MCHHIFGISELRNNFLSHIVLEKNVHRKSLFFRFHLYQMMISSLWVSNCHRKLSVWQLSIGSLVVKLGMMEFSFFKLNLTKVKVSRHPNDRDLNQGILHPWTKFGDRSLNGWWVMVQASSVLAHTRTDGQTYAGNANTRRPKPASDKNPNKKPPPVAR